MNPSSALRDWMPTKIESIQLLSGHSARIAFCDGVTGAHDFSGLVDSGGPMVKPLRKDTYFKRVFLEQGVMTWPNGFDLCADALRLEMEAAGELSQIQNESA